MTATNDFLPFAVGGSANVVSQSAYAALSTLLANGFQSGIANSQQLNKVWRQSSIMAAVIGTIIQQSGQNATDDGTTSNLVTNLKAAIMGSKVAVNAVTGAVTLTNANAGQTQILTGTPAYAVTLPLASTCAPGAVLSFINVGTVNVTIQRQGTTDTIKPNATGITSIVLTPGDTLEVECDGSGVWYAFDGSAILPYAGVMSGANFTTAAQFDSTTKLATTEFVQRALGNQAGFDSYVAGSTSLTGAKAGRLQVLAVNSGVALTLPSVSGCPAGTVFRFHAAYASGSGTVTRAGTDIIYFGSTAVNTVTFNGGDTLELTSTGSAWYATGGSLELAYSAGTFGSSLSASGYQKLPSGLIMQWGSGSYSSAGTTVTYPIAYPNSVVAVQLTAGAGSGASVNLGSKTSFTAFINASGTGTWISIGY